jgi:hypothetical protein
LQENVFDFQTANSILAAPSFAVMAGLVPAIHVFGPLKSWMPGTRPGMTK